jgi:hypothetical protein
MYYECYLKLIKNLLTFISYRNSFLTIYLFTYLFLYIYFYHFINIYCQKNIIFLLTFQTKYIIILLLSYLQYSYIENYLISYKYNVIRLS